MTFHYYDIIIRPIDPEIEIDFDTHGFWPILGRIYCVHFTLLYKALEGRCEKPNFGQYDFQKSIFSLCGVNGYEHDLGCSETNLDVFYTILNFFFRSKHILLKKPSKTMIGAFLGVAFLVLFIEDFLGGKISCSLGDATHKN